ESRLGWLSQLTVTRERGNSSTRSSWTVLEECYTSSKTLSLVLIPRRSLMKRMSREKVCWKCGHAFSAQAILIVIGRPTAFHARQQNGTTQYRNFQRVLKGADGRKG